MEACLHIAVSRPQNAPTVGMYSRARAFHPAAHSELLLHVQASHGVEPGAHVSVQSTSELMRVTLAYAAVQSMFRALRQWRDLHAAGSDEAYRRQLAAADAASVHTHVTNALGVAAEMQLDFGDRVYVLASPHHDVQYSITDSPLHAFA